MELNPFFLIVTVFFEQVVHRKGGSSNGKLPPSPMEVIQPHLPMYSDMCVDPALSYVYNETMPVTIFSSKDLGTPVYFKKSNLGSKDRLGICLEMNLFPCNVSANTT